MKRQYGIRVTIKLFIPFEKNDFVSLSAAIDASNKLTSKDGLAKLADVANVELEESNAVQTTRENKE